MDQYKKLVERMDMFRGINTVQPNALINPSKVLMKSIEKQMSELVGKKCKDIEWFRGLDIFFNITGVKRNTLGFIDGIIKHK